MRSNAANALNRLFTPETAKSMAQIVERAIKGETGGSFIESAGGASVKSFDSTTITGNTAVVTATVTQWDTVGQIQPDGSVRWATPQADVNVADNLVREASGTWRVATRTWSYAPGQGP
jgi:hypothetical protein